jgi:hypothetical protein
MNNINYEQPMQLSAARLPSKSFWARGFVTKGEQSAHQGFSPAHPSQVSKLQPIR